MKDLASDRGGARRVLAASPVSGAEMAADEARDLRRACRNRRRRRSDGALHSRHRDQAQPDEPPAGGRQQGRRRRRRRISRRQSEPRRPAQADHHAVESLHHAAGHRHAVQLERPDTGLDAGARSVCAVGERRVAVQDGRRVPQRGQGGERSRSSAWEAPARSRKTRSSPPRSSG